MLRRAIILLLMSAPALFAKTGDCAWGYRSAALVSPDGRRSAHVDTVVSPAPVDSDCCEHDVRLVREHAPGSPPVRHRGETEEPWTMNLIDWSPDSRRLLVGEQALSCNTDYSPTRIAVFDDALLSFWVLDESGIVEAHPAAEDCAIEIQPLGFLADGRVVVSSEQSSTTDTECNVGLGPDATRWWAWDPVKGTIRPLKKDTMVRAWGSRRLPRWLPR